jgi:hypothetical protein
MPEVLAKYLPIGRMKRFALITVGAVALLGGAIAAGQPVRQGDLIIGFDAGFAPHALPRDRVAPVRVDLDGSIATTDGSRPPQLRRISVALNRYGRLTTRGLPSCAPGELESVSSATALERCRGALVGRGRFGANVGFPGQPVVPIEGRVLAFNSSGHGRQSILVHIYASSPVRASVVLDFKVSHRRQGKFGTVVSTRIPRIASDLGYVTDISLSLGRRYRVGGRGLSFLSASCAAPSGFPGAVFAFARGSFAFANGQRLTTTVVRDCVVR